jgi:hypothetical protein
MKTWSTSVDDLLHAFRDGLIAIIPIAERVHMAWKEPDNYDDWDIISKALYKSIVVASILWAAKDRELMPLLEYDTRVTSYKEHSFIVDSENPKNSAFICFETESEPFDICLFARLDDDFNVIELYRRPVLNGRYLFVGRELNDTIFLDDLTVII